MKSVLEQSRKVMGWKSHVSWVYISNLKKIPWKNEIPADIFLVPPPTPPPRLRKNITKIIEEFYYKLLVFIHATAVFQL